MRPTWPSPPIKQPLHLLVNNAGLAGQRGLTQDGFELTFGVNHLGHFLFTHLLLDTIKESAPARIVNVASASHYQAKKGIPWDRLRQRTRGLTAMDEYAVSKLANVLFTQELARRTSPEELFVVSLHPGNLIATDVMRRIPGPIERFELSPS